MTSYEQHKKFLECVAAGAMAELHGFLAAQACEQPNPFGSSVELQARYNQGFVDGKAKLEGMVKG